MRLQPLVIALTLVVCLGCASSASESRASVQKRIQELEDTLDKAFRDRDAGWLADFRAGRAHFSNVATRDLLVRLYGDTAIATGVKSRTGTFDAKDDSGDLRFTHVWTRASGRWQLVASQSTRVN